MSILLTKFVTCIAWVYNNEFFYYKVVTCNALVVTCNALDKFLLAKSTKNVLRDVNFTNLKTLGGYIAKSKPPKGSVCN